MWFNVPLFPDRASTAANQVDALYFFILAIISAVAIVVFVVAAVFAVKFRREAHPQAEQIHGNLLLELGWSIAPLFAFLAMFAWGAVIYFDFNRPPTNAMEIYGVGKQWMWKFQHLEGQREINQLHVPVGRDVRVVLTSQDVIHSFGVPAFRLKGDVIPGRYTMVWFHPTQTGSYHLFCDQYCGTQHSGMIGQVIVMEPADYQNWLSGGGEGSLAQQGEKLFQQLGCNTCHRSDSQARGPNLAGLAGSKVNLADGRTIIADDNYIRESIVTSQAKIVAGFQPIMPVFQGQISEEQLIALLNYIKSMKNEQPGGPIKTSPESQKIPGVPGAPNAPATAKPPKQ